MNFNLSKCLLAFSIFCCNFLFGQASPISFYATGGDAEVNQITPTTTNNGLTAAVKVNTTSSGAFRYLLAFDFSSIPSDAVITSAILKLYTTNSSFEPIGTNTTFAAQGITTSFNESNVTFNSQPSYTTANQVASSSYVSGSGVRTFDVRPLIQAHVNRSIPITGILIRRNPETTVTAANSYHTDEATSNRPVLEITYIRVSTASINKATTTTSTDGSINPVVEGGTNPSGLSFQWYNLNTTNFTAATISLATGSSLSSRVYGWYGLRITSGTINYYTSFLLGVKNQSVNIRFPQDPLFTDDANLASNASPATTNFGNDINLRFGFNSPNTRTSLLRYRMFMDPQNDVTNASLYLFGKAHTTTANASTISRLTSDWAELSVNNTCIPTFGSDMNISIPTTTTTTQNQVINVTDYFKFWTNNGNMYYGFRFSGPSTGYQDYHSSDAVIANVAKRPYVLFTVFDRNSSTLVSSTKLKRELDGTYATTTTDGKLKIYFEEEYRIEAGKFIELSVYDQSRVLKSKVDMSGALSGTNPNVALKVPYNFDNNEFELNLNCSNLTNNSFYVLEVLTSTGEKRYLRFQYTSNQSCF
jgi:hypothetical protein